MDTRLKYRLAIAWIFRLAFVVLLIFSGVGKLLDSREASEFLIALTHSHPLAKKWAADLIMGLSIIEIILAGSLLHRRSLNIGLIIFSGLLILFSVALAVMLVRDVPLSSCGCLGAFGEEMAVEIALLRNLVLLGAVVGCHLLLASASTRHPSLAVPSTKSSQQTK